MNSKWSKEFKENAIKLAEKEGVLSASEKKGVLKRQIYDWRREGWLATVRPPKGFKTGESVEIYCERLEREIAEISEGNMILKKRWFFWWASSRNKAKMFVYMDS